MKNSAHKFYRDERGSAILMVLGILAMVTVLGIVFAMTSRNARTAAVAKSDGAGARLAAESATARALGFLNYMQTIGDKPAGYVSRPYVGNFDCGGALPMISKIITLAGSSIDQNVMYTHDDDGYNETENGEFSLFNVISSTPYGAALKDYTSFGNAESSGAEQIQFVNVTGKDGKFDRRYGYLILSEGTKFDINKLIKLDYIIPFVNDDGIIKASDYDSSDPDNPYDFDTDMVDLVDYDDYFNPFAIMGYRGNGNNFTPVALVNEVVVEDETLRYGLHSQELRVDNPDYISKLANFGNPPKWFNYDMLLADGDGVGHFKDEDILTFNLASGFEDKEEMLDNPEDPDPANTIPKENIQFARTDLDPDPLDWDHFSGGVEQIGDRSTLFGKLSDAMFGDKKAFNDDDELTWQVMANLTDFCDSDNRPNYWYTENLAASPMAEVHYFGNEKVPYLSGVEIKIEKDRDFKAENRAEIPPTAIVLPGGSWIELVPYPPYIIIHPATPGSGTPGTPAQFRVTTAPKLKLSLQAALGNIFNERIDKPAKVEFTVKGNVCLGYYVKENGRVYMVGPNFTGGNVTSSDYARNLGTADPPNDLGAVGDAAAREGIRNFLSAQARPFTVTLQATPSGDLAERAFEQISLNVISGDLPAGSNITGWTEGQCIGFFGAVAITEVLGKTYDGGSYLTDLMHFETNADWINLGLPSGTNWEGGNVPSLIFGGSKSNPAPEDGYVNGTISGTLGKNIGGENTLYLRYLSADPRFNHKADGWNLGFLGDAGDPADTYARFTGTPTKNLIAETLDSIVECGKNSAIPEGVDLEPELAVNAAGNGLAKTFSTAFIPNAPISSLWQLGAIHRGEPGCTINLKKYGGPDTGKTYDDGDAWILEGLKLSKLLEDANTFYKFNPNCFNEAAYRYLFSYIPYDSTGTLGPKIYFPNDDVHVEDNIGSQYGDSPDISMVNLADAVVFNAVGAAAQSYNPVEAFCKFISIDDDYGIDDRTAESFLGCSAALLSTRYETFTIISVGQTLKYLFPGDEFTSEEYTAIEAQLVNPIKIGTGTDEAYYSVMGTQIHQVTVVRDCWANTFKVVQNRLL